MDHGRLHWVMGEYDEHTACGLVAEGQARATDLQVDGGKDACSDCLRLWERYSLRAVA